jgi:hypothetical protein
MKVGKEPMRTFGDLLQFYQTKAEDPKGTKPPVVERPPVAKPETSVAAGEPEAVVRETPPVQDDTSV